MATEFSLKNQFLLAMPSHFGGYFANSLIYVCEHNSEGGMGLVVNKPLSLSIAELLSQMDIKSTHEIDETLIVEGGPMDPQRGFILHTADGHFETSAYLEENLQLSTARHALTAIATGYGPSQYLVATGYTGWGPGQLEEEMVDNAWLSCPSDLQILFNEPHPSRVARAAKNIGVDFSLMSTQAGYD